LSLNFEAVHARASWSAAKKLSPTTRLYSSLHAGAASAPASEHAPPPQYSSAAVKQSMHGHSGVLVRVQHTLTSFPRFLLPAWDEERA